MLRGRNGECGVRSAEKEATAESARGGAESAENRLVGDSWVRASVDGVDQVDDVDLVSGVAI
jgi:hypothetical protein